MAAGLVMAIARSATPAAKRLPAACLGGLAIASYALSAALAASQFGVGKAVICVVVVQRITSSLFDRFGVVGASILTLDVRRLARLLLRGSDAKLTTLT